MIFLWIYFLIYEVSSEFATPSFLKAAESVESEEQNLEELPSLKTLHNVGFFKDAEHRGQKWYDDDTSKTNDEDALSKSSKTSSQSESSQSESQSSDASSFETAEKKIIARKYRECTPCPHDKLKKYSNRGIKWICGSYQRARRTFKSPCMMRYRNCQDGTMFVKIYDHVCKNDSFHGRHWFYMYKT